MSNPLTTSGENTLGQGAALLTDTVSDHLSGLHLEISPPAHPVHSHHVQGETGLGVLPAGPVHGQPVALPVAGAVGAGEAGDARRKI